MKNPQSGNPEEANRAGRVCVSPLALLLTLLAVALGVMAAPAGASRSSEIQDHLRKAAEYLKAKDPNSAVKEFDAVLALDPRNAAAYANLGVIAFFARDYPNAAKYLRNALAIDPSLVKTQALLGITDRRLGRPSAQRLLEESFPRLKNKNLQIQTGLELANIYYQQGNLDRAASVMRSLVDLGPDNIEILYMAQRVYAELADDTLNKLVLLAPGSARMQQVIAEKLVNAGDLQGAIPHYKNALKLDPHLPGVHFELGEAILESFSHDPNSQADAEAEFETAKKTEGDTAGIECELGRIALLRSNIAQAFARYRQAMALNPENAEAQLGVGRVLLAMQKPQEAVSHLRMAAASDPLNSQARYQLAIAYRDLHLTDQAREQMRMFDEIEQAMRQVRALYRQMGRRPVLKDEEHRVAAK